jgi:hypothetical protein
VDFKSGTIPLWKKQARQVGIEKHFNKHARTAFSEKTDRTCTN